MTFALISGTFYWSSEVEALTVSCERIGTTKFETVGELKTCWMNTKVPIKVPDVTILTKDESVTGIFFTSNKNIEFLPIQIPGNLQNLVGYSAHRCSIKKVSKPCFAGLKNLKLLYLHKNQIEMIPSDTFEDLIAMEFLFLCKFLFNFIDDFF